MSQQYKQEEKNLRNIVNNFISPTHDRSLTIAIYYKNTKLRQLFIKNNLHQDTSNSHVVYQYTCPMDGCNPSQIYIGYTTTSLKQRMTAHTQNGVIRTHQHNSPPTQDQDTRNIRTHQSTLQKSRQDRTTDHGSTSHQTAQPSSEQSAVRRYPYFTYILIVMYTAPNLSFFSFSLHRQVMPCKYCNYETCYEFVAVASAFLKYTSSILLFYISIRF